MSLNLNNYDEKRDFLESLYQAFASDERITGMLNNENGTWPTEDITAQFELHQNSAEASVNDMDEWLKDMHQLMVTSGALFATLKNIHKQGKEALTEDLDLALEQVSDTMAGIGSYVEEHIPSQKTVPQSYMENYLSTFGKGKMGTSFVNFLSGTMQTLDNVALMTSSVTVDPELERNIELEEQGNTIEQEIENETKDLVQDCLKNNVSFDSIDGIFHAAENDYNKKNDEFLSVLDQTTGWKNIEKSVLGTQEELDNVSAQKGEVAELGETIEQLRAEAISIREELDAIREERQNASKKYLGEGGIRELNEEIEKNNILIKQKKEAIAEIENNANFKNDYPIQKDLENRYELLSGAMNKLNAMKKPAPPFSLSNELQNLKNGIMNEKEYTSEQKKYIQGYLEQKAIISSYLYAPGKAGYPVEKIFETVERPGEDPIEMLNSKALTPVSTMIERMKNSINISLSSPYSEIYRYKEETGILKNLEKEQSKCLALRDKIIHGVDVNKQFKERSNALAEREKAFQKNCLDTAKKLGLDLPPERATSMDADKILIEFEQSEWVKEGQTLQKKGDVLTKLNERKATLEQAKKIPEGRDDLKAKQQEAEKAKKVLEAANALKTKKDSVISKMDNLKDIRQNMLDSNALANSKKQTKVYRDMLDELDKKIPATSKDSDFYKNMRKAMADAKACLDDSTKSPMDRQEAMKNLQKKAQEYIAAKEKQWRPWPFASEQRHNRLDAAKSIVSFCKTAEEGILHVKVLDESTVTKLGQQAVDNRKQLSATSAAKLKQTVTKQLSDAKQKAAQNTAPVKNQENKNLSAGPA